MIGARGEMVAYNWVSPADYSSLALNNEFCAIRTLFDWLKENDPLIALQRFGESLNGYIHRMYDYIASVNHKVARRIKRTFDFIGRVVIDVFNPSKMHCGRRPGYLSRRLPRIVFRKMLLDRISKMVEWLFTTFRDVLRRWESSIRRFQEPVFVGQYATNIGYEAMIDRNELIIVDENAHRRILHIKSEKVWEILRLLLGSEDPRGMVKLPNRFRSFLVTKDSNSDRVKDDLWILDMHIHKSGDGRYYLSPSLREPLKWDSGHF